MIEVVPAKSATCDQQTFLFNTLGILNTSRDNSIYKITAVFDGKEYLFNSIDWQATTHKAFRIHQDDFVIDKDSYLLKKYMNIIYKIEKFNAETMQHEPDYAFAVQPLCEKQPNLILGQFQLPLFEGRPPDILFENKSNALKIIEYY